MNYIAGTIYIIYQSSCKLANCLFSEIHIWTNFEFLISPDLLKCYIIHESKFQPINHVGQTLILLGKHGEASASAFKWEQEESTAMNFAARFFHSVI